MSVENKLKNLYNSGMEFTKNKQFQKALDCYNKILKTTPNDVETLYKKSIALENLCKYDKAIECYDVILKIKPDYTDVLHSKGQVLAKLSQYDKAIECYDTILKINPEDTNALYTKGNAFFELNQYDKAIECYNNVLKIKSEDINALFNKGNALFELGQPDKALKCYDRHFKKNPPICSISPGYPVYCPKCNSTRVLIFYDPRFTPRLQNKWDELIYGKRISLENRWEKIKDENLWGKLKKGTEKPNWICKDCYDGGIILEYPIDKKIFNEFKKYEKTFTEKSNPLYWDRNGEKITLKEIYDKSNVKSSSLALIAVTRQQYTTKNFLKYRKYIENTFNNDTIYYGLWPDKENNKVEYDILYTIDGTNKNEIQKHLNLHNKINNGLAQKMALIVDKDGAWKIQNNKKYTFN